MVVRFRVEKGIPLPPHIPSSRRGPKRRWPFAEMEPYDSFLIVTDVPSEESRRAFDAAKRFGVRVAIRQREGGIRIWKLPDKDADP